MTPSFQISNFKFQSSNKLQISKFKFWSLVFGFSLIFDFWFLNFERPKGDFECLK